MKLEGEFSFQSGREQVWASILDPEVLAAAIPGVKKFDRVSEDRYETAMEVRVGPVTGVFEGSVELRDKEELRGYTMIVEAKGPSGFAKGTSRIDFSECEGGTLMKYAAQLQVGGKLAGVGQRLLETMGKSMARQCLESIDQAIRTRLSGTPAARDHAPTQGRLAMGVAKDVFRENIRWIALAAILAAAALALWMLS